jgi:hypothetical protein
MMIARHSDRAMTNNGSGSRLSASDQSAYS